MQQKNSPKKAISIYIHYPFCKSKCPYCDFNSHVKDGVDHERFLQGYLRELDFFAAKIGSKENPRKVKTIFFGGGTPSLMPIFLVEKILEKISQLWQMDEACEITLEANPTSFEAEKFKEFRRVGINRLSLGIQALNDADLKFLGREHSAQEAIETIKTASKIFDNFSFDLIYARPKQSLEAWKSELETAISFGTKHLSLYQLTIEKGTKFYSQHQRKEFVMPDEELSAQFYEMTNQITRDNGFELYEISNYAKIKSPKIKSSKIKSSQGIASCVSRSEGASNTYECLHNLVYWQGGDYLGIGAGAHSRIYLDENFAANSRRAIMMIHEPMSWLKKVEETGAGIQTDEKISAEELLEELILMGLRLRSGINDEIFQSHFGKKLSEIFDFEKLRVLENQGLIEIETNSIKIPDQSRLLTNAIITKVVTFLR